MIKENEKLFGQLNVITDGIITYLMLPLAFWLRFYVLPGGEIAVPLQYYMVLGVFFTLAQLFVFAAFGLYQTRHVRLRTELPKLAAASVLNLLLLLGWLFLEHANNYSRQALFIFFLLSFGALGTKRVIMRRTLRRLRQNGFNQKNVVLIGGGDTAKRFLQVIRDDLDYGYRALGYIASRETDIDLPYLGTFDEAADILDGTKPDEVVSAIDREDYEHTPKIIEACEYTGCKLMIIPFYLEYMSAKPQFDDINGIPLLNIRRIPLDNWANAFVKRTVDVIGSLLLLIVSSPIMLFCAIGVKLSSPGPIIFAQERVGRNKKTFRMYKFRSMRVNTQQDTAWSSTVDDRRTKFGSFIRKYSLDEFPQFWNVLIGDMSLVGPRPELPHFVDQFKKDVPLYMVKHQVRPGITGWAQVNDFRGDTSIKGRIEHDIYYIENWSLLFDIRILFMTVFGGKFKNSEKMG